MKTRFRRDIQGLRALAVLAVTINHAFPKLLEGGYVGVDIFFVISGYLISRNIVREIETGHFSIAEFYRKRVRRILPSLLVVLLFTVVAGGMILSPSEYMELAATAAATILFVSNFAFLKLTGYFDGAAEYKPLLHMWSLAVEEQFYILFPPFIMSFWSKFGRTITTVSLALALVASLILAEIQLPVRPDAVYYMLPTRAFELLIGVIVGISGIPALKSPRARDAASVLAIMMMLAAIALFNPGTPFPGIAALLPCLGAALLIHAGAGGEETLGGRLMSVRSAVYIGTISYSLYLWHWPILAYLRVALGASLPPLIAGLAIVFAILMADLSYRFIERPFLSNEYRFDYLKAGAAAIIISCAATALIWVGQGFPQRYPSTALTMLSAKDDINVRRAECHYETAVPLPKYSQGCHFGKAGVTPDLAVWGDSHGAELAAFLGKHAKEKNRSVIQLTSSSCPPATKFILQRRPHCADRNQTILEGLLSDDSIRTVVMVANGQAYLKNHAQLAGGMRDAAKKLLAAKKRVIIVKQIPLLHYDAPQKTALMDRYRFSLTNIGISSVDARQASARYDLFIDKMKRDANLTVYDPKSSLCDQALCRSYMPSRGVLYFDDVHLSMVGTGVAFDPLAKALYH